VSGGGLFVITRDPLDWLAERGTAWATANADGDALELPVYVLRDEIARRLELNGGDVHPALGAVAESAVRVGGEYEGILVAGAYPGLAFRGEAPRLLSHMTDEPTLATPAVEVRSPEWEPIGLGAVQDLVQDAFGPVDLDRSAVVLDPAPAPRPGCPACAGERFGFPGDLQDATARMCTPHREQAAVVTDDRLYRASRSNPAGWRAIGLGSARVSGGLEPPGAPLPQRRHTAPSRNDPCPCGSGRKYQHCCGR
jgi:hypothetical protein